MSKLVTSAGTAYYPQISQPSYKFDENGIYSCKLHVSKKDFEEFSKKEQLKQVLMSKHIKRNLPSRGSRNLKGWKVFLFVLPTMGSMRSMQNNLRRRILLKVN